MSIKWFVKRSMMRITIVDWINLLDDCPTLMPFRLTVIEGSQILNSPKQLEELCYVISLKGDYLMI